NNPKNCPDPRNGDSREALPADDPRVKSPARSTGERPGRFAIKSIMPEGVLMGSRKTCRRASGVLLAIGLLAASVPPPAWAGSRHLDPDQVVPMAQVPPQHREAVADLIRDPTLHQKGQADTFPCNPKVYLNLVN